MHRPLSPQSEPHPRTEDFFIDLTCIKSFHISVPAKKYIHTLTLNRPHTFSLNNQYTDYTHLFSFSGRQRQMSQKNKEGMMTARRIVFCLMEKNYSFRSLYIPDLHILPDRPAWTQPFHTQPFGHRSRLCKRNCSQSEFLLLHKKVSPTVFFQKNTSRIDRKTESAE